MSDYTTKFRSSKRTFAPLTTVWVADGAQSVPMSWNPGTVISKSEVLYSRGNPYQLLGQADTKVSDRVYQNAWHGLGDIGGNFLHAVKYRHGNVWQTGDLYLGTPFRGTQKDPYFMVTNALGTPVTNGTQLRDEANMRLLSDTNLDARGTTLIKRADPTKSQAEAAQSLVELFREGIPSVIPNLLKGKGLKGTAGDYLNLQFGWKPLIADAEKLYRSVKLARVLMEQFERDSGRVIRRRRVMQMGDPVKTTETSINVPQGAPWPQYASYAYSRYGLKTTQTEITSEVWFSGAFQYHFSEAGKWQSELRRLEQRYDYLFGLSMNADTIWELTAWSWLIDWFTNAGDVVSNVSTALRYGDIMKYGYVMHKYRSSSKQTITGCVLRDGRRVPDLVHEEVLVAKKRRRATPFGFGLSFDGLTPYQTSILIALGISRRR